jgi:hypothetical protein
LIHLNNILKGNNGKMTGLSPRKQLARLEQKSTTLGPPESLMTLRKGLIDQASTRR